MASPISAANAYAKLARLADPSASLGKAGAGRFGRAELRRDGQGRDRLGGRRPARSPTALAQGMAAGKANIVDVVTAVTETEVAIESLVSVRDKVIQAYEEIMRMPI